MLQKKNNAGILVPVFLFFILIANTTLAQPESPAAPTTAIPPQNSLTVTADARRRQQAYLRYLAAQRLKGEAERTRSLRLFEEAAKVFKEAIQLDPNAAEPHLDLGEIYFFYLARPELAEREAEEAIRLEPQHVGAHLLLARRYVYTAKMENNPRSLFLEQAIRAYEKVAALDPGQAEAWALLADLYQLKRDTAQELHALEKWTGAPVPNDPVFYQRLMNADLTPDQAYYRLSQLYLSQGKGKEAIEAARRAYEANPDSNDYARNLISLLREAGTSAAELRIYGQLIKSAHSPTLLIGYGAALIRAGRYPEAVERLRDYAKVDPTNVSAVALLALAQRRANQRPAAIETLKAGLLRVEPSSRINLLLELGQTYEELGRNEEAILQYEQAFESLLTKGALTPLNAPLFNETVNRLARVCRRAGYQTKLQALLARARRVVDEHNPLLDQITIEGLRADGKRREALALTQAAVRRYPEDRALKFTEALLLAELRRFSESVELLHSMSRGRPEDATDDATVYLILSSVQAQADQLPEAESSARKALAFNPDDPEILLQLGAVQERAGQYEAAEQTLRDLLRRHPDHATALNNLGYFLLERGARYNEALPLIEQAIAIEPSQGSFWDSLGWAQYKLGQLDKARASLEKALSLARRNATIHEHLGDVLRDLGRLVEARRHWERALEYSIAADESARLKVKLKDGR